MGDGPKPPSSWCGSQVRTMGIGLKSAIVSASARQPAFMSHLAPGNMAGMDRHLERGCLTWTFLWKSNLFLGTKLQDMDEKGIKLESTWNEIGMKWTWTWREKPWPDCDKQGARQVHLLMGSWQERMEKRQDFEIALHLPHVSPQPKYRSRVA